ncbi:adenosylmethionine decarboxylase [Neobacillus niacini]|uniref:adenosylmethionine decarboxylase n=1 Tax=Neobacillus niacini TaxID=86668 RepID=UPI001C8DDBDF|nr:adenosylmethionine decarboxylase [Neobacillus niacini]MBY0146705.1 adenosylmethionine decarboxylase [Neobacillus niacini]
MTKEGKHIIIDAFECESAHLNDINFLEEMCKKAALDANMEILYSYFHQFEPQGVTGVLVLSTSHLSIHTWPEERYVSLDFYTCGTLELTPQVDFLIKELSSKQAKVYSISRGVSYPQLIRCEELGS